jgi:hypothetical protein
LIVHEGAKTAQAVDMVDPTRYADWGTIIDQQPNAGIFHTANWAAVLRDTYKFDPAYFCDRSDGSTSVLPLMEVNSWLTGRRGVGLPFTDECEPLCSQPWQFDSLYGALREHAAKRKWKTWELRGGARFLPPTPSTTFYGHSLDLSMPPAIERLPSGTRRAVRKAEKNKVTVTFSESLEATASFYKLLCRTRRRHGLPPQPFTFFSHVQKHLLAPGKGFVATATHDDTPIAGAIFLCFGNEAYYKFVASDERYKELCGTSAVVWRSIEALAQQGIKRVNLGRTSNDNAGLRRFKLSWNAVERRIDYFKCNIQRSEFVMSKDRASGWHTRVFGLLPLSLAKLVGAATYRHIA